MFGKCENQVVKTGFGNQLNYYTCKTCPIWKLGEFGKILNLDNLVSFHQPKYILKNQLGFQNVKAKIETSQFSQKCENHPTLKKTSFYYNTSTQHNKKQLPTV
jgi:hypothetical protein